MNSDPYDDISRRFAEALAKSRRQSLWVLQAAVLNDWTGEEIRHFVATGEQPEGKPAILEPSP